MVAPADAVDSVTSTEPVKLPPAGLNNTGLTIPLTAGACTVTVPLEGVTAIGAVPVGSDSMGLTTAITVEVFVVVGEIPRLTTPTVPLAIVLLFVPYTIQTMDPAEGLQIK